jgi:hypothetical protein
MLTVETVGDAPLRYDIIYESIDTRDLWHGTTKRKRENGREKRRENGNRFK